MALKLHVLAPPPATHITKLRFQSATKPTFLRKSLLFATIRKPLATRFALLDEQEQVSFTQVENSLIEAIIGIQGRGLSASPQQLTDVDAAVRVLEGLQGVPDPRLPAKELLIDPFLASDDEQELMGSPKVPIQKPFQNGKMEERSNGTNPKRSTNMTIKGTMNPEDDAIFLKVQFSDEHGNHARNIFFPFDIVNDTAIDVATEMVRELEISDWEPSEIAEMIEEEISSLVPSWKREHNRQHSFSYEDEDDDDDVVTRRPFYSSSNSSSHNSLLAFNSSQLLSQNKMTSDHNWLQDDLFSNDDTSSVCSLNSFNYSNINYCSGYEEDFDSNLRGGGEPLPFAMTHKSTRFRPSEISIPTNDHYKHYNSQRSSLRAHNCSKHQQQQPKLARIRSLVDVRSQLLHRSLVEEIQKRRLSKTVGAIETIGFQEPGEFSGK